jgi:uncharacterized protein YukE
MYNYEVNNVSNPKIVKIDSDALKTKIELLKNEKDEIDDVLNEFSKDIGGMPKYWSGTTGDMVNDELLKYVSRFVNISDQLAKYIKFLEDVSSTYEAFDNYLIEQIESN